MTFSSGSIVIFSHSGKTMIGKIFFGESEITDFTSEESVFVALGVNTDVYYVKNPAEIVFDLDVPASGSAQLKWEVKPLFYKDLVNDGDVCVTYPKNLVTITNLSGDKINQLIVAAYNDICG